MPAIIFPVLGDILRGRGHQRVSFEHNVIDTNAGMWATVTEMAPTGNLPIDGDPFLTVQQVVPDYDNHRCDVMVWIDATPVDISYRVTLYIASGL